MCDEFAELVIRNEEGKIGGRIRIELDDLERVKKHKWFIEDMNIVSIVNGKHTFFFDFISKLSEGGVNCGKMYI